jgi:hypothetical protein
MFAASDLGEESLIGLAQVGDELLEGHRVRSEPEVALVWRQTAKDAIELTADIIDFAFQ